MIGRNIKRVLERQGKTQRELAEEIGVTECSVSRYINGDRVPKATMFAKIADALGVTTDQLISGEENPFDLMRLRVSKYNYSSMLDEMIQTLSDKEDRKEFLRYARIEINKRLNRIGSEGSDGQSGSN